MSYLGKSLLAAVSVILALASLALFANELHAFRSSAQRPVLEIKPATPYSLKGIGQLLEQCETGLTSGSSLFSGSIDLTLANACLDRANEILLATRAHAFAHLVAARASGKLGDVNLMRHHLLASAALAPHEGWLSKRRFKMAMAEPEVEGLDGRWLRAEIATLLSFQSGAQLLASAYTDNRSLRAIIRAVADKAPKAQQERLIWQTRLMAQKS